MDKFQFDTVLCAMADKVENLQDKIVLQQSALDSAHRQMADLEDKVRDQEEALDHARVALERAEKLPPIHETGQTMINTAQVLWTVGHKDEMYAAIKGLIDATQVGNKIGAIKYTRTLTSLGLLEAKNLVEEVWSEALAREAIQAANALPMGR